jgi:hypothetical protein
MWILSSSSHYYCCLYPLINVVACCCSCLVFGASRTPKKRECGNIFLFGPVLSVFFKFHTLNNEKPNLCRCMQHVVKFLVKFASF